VWCTFLDVGIDFSCSFFPPSSSFVSRLHPRLTQRKYRKPIENFPFLSLFLSPEANKQQTEKTKRSESNGPLLSFFLSMQPNTEDANKNQTKTKIKKS